MSPGLCIVKLALEEWTFKFPVVEPHVVHVRVQVRHVDTVRIRSVYANDKTTASGQDPCLFFYDKITTQPLGTQRCLTSLRFESSTTNSAASRCHVKLVVVSSIVHKTNQTGSLDPSCPIVIPRRCAATFHRCCKTTRSPDLSSIDTTHNYLSDHTCGKNAMFVFSKLAASATAFFVI